MGGRPNGGSCDYKATWKSLGRAHRKRVSDAIERGEALPDPSDARLAQHVAAQLHRQIKHLLWLPPLTTAVAIALGVATRGARIGVFLLALATGALLALVVVPASWKWRRVYALARDRNAEVVRRAGDDLGGNRL